MQDCPNPNCRTFSGDRTQVATGANYCIACGWTVSSDANKVRKSLQYQLQKTKQKNIDLNEKLKSANIKINSLENELIEKSNNIELFEDSSDNAIGELEKPLLIVSVALVVIVIFVIYNFLIR